VHQLRRLATQVAQRWARFTTSHFKSLAKALEGFRKRDVHLIGQWFEAERSAWGKNWPGNLLTVLFSACRSTSTARLLIPPTSRDFSLIQLTISNGTASPVFADAAAS
jgi:hypothetical protein